MFDQIITIIKTKPSILRMLLFFIIMMFIFILLDTTANSYEYYIEEFGTHILVLHILLDVLISLVISITIELAYLSNKICNYEPKSSDLWIISVILGFFTFGCTPCVVAFVSSIGITFTPIILPNGNLLWKFVSLLISIIGLSITIYALRKKDTCQIKE